MVGKAAFGAASSVAVRQIATYVSAARSNQRTRPDSSADAEQQLARLLELHRNFEAKISMLIPIIDLIDMAGARGNSILSMLVPVTAHLKVLMDDFSGGLVKLVPKDLLSVPDEDSQVSNLSDRLAGTRINTSRSSSNRRKSVALLQKSGVDAESIEKVCNDLEVLLTNFDSHIPYLQLSLTASGISFGTNLAKHISLSRLMTASHKLRDCDLAIKSGDVRERFATVGSKIHIRLYSLFFGSIRTKSNHQWTWTEKYPRAFLSLERMNEKSTFSYQLRIERDLDDGLVHDADNADENEIVISLPCIRKLFYSNAGRLLKIEDSLLPCLIIKFQSLQGDTTVKSKSKKKEPTVPTTPSKQPAELVWYAFEYLSEDALQSSNGESESSVSEVTDGSDSENDEFHSDTEGKTTAPKPSAGFNETVTESSISELEYMIRLANLETCRQQEHASISDELIKFHLESDQLVADSIL